MKHLLKLLNQVESYIPDFEKSNTTVSQSTIGWQIDHSLLVVNGVINELKKSNPENYKWKFNKTRLFLQTINTIPRGKVKTPNSVKPSDSITRDGLILKIELAKKQVVDLEQLPAHSYFTHPIFGDLKLKTALWFLKLHTLHHLKIIQDIQKKS